MNTEEYKNHLLEQNIVTLWAFTATESGCLAYVDALHDMAQCYPESSYGRELIEFSRDLAFAKGNLFALRKRQDYQLREAQTAFVGVSPWDS